MAPLEHVIRFWSWTELPERYRPPVDLPIPPDWVAVYSPAPGFDAVESLLQLRGCILAKRYPASDGTVILAGWKSATGVPEIDLPDVPIPPNLRLS